METLLEEMLLVEMLLIISIDIINIKMPKKLTSVRIDCNVKPDEAEPERFQ